MSSEFRMTRRVAFAETDLAGVLHFANYFRYMEEIEHSLPIDQQQCPQCGLLLEALSSSEDSEEIHWEVRVILRILQLWRVHQSENNTMIHSCFSSPEKNCRIDRIEGNHKWSNEDPNPPDGCKSPGPC